METTTHITPESIGLSIEVEGQPQGKVDRDGKNEWPHVAFMVVLKKGDKTILKQEYRMGTGHFDPKGISKYSISKYMPGNHNKAEDILDIWQRKPFAKFVDQEFFARVVAAVAQHKKIMPKLNDFVHSVIMDGRPYFEHLCFEEWADEYGYDTDSIKANKIYEQCCDIGRQLARGLTKAEIDALAEWASE